MCCMDKKKKKKKKASEVCFPKLKRREAPSKACGKLPRLLGRLKNGIGNFCINKNPKWLQNEREKNWNYLNT